MEAVAEVTPTELGAAMKKRPAWRKAKPTILTPAMTVEQALATIVRDSVHHLRANENCVLARAHKEGVHQMRVATRRLRSGLSLFKTCLPAESRDETTGELKWLIGELGPARDWDVFLSEVLKPVRKQMPDEKRLELLQDYAEERRDLGYKQAEATLRSERYADLVRCLGAFVETARERGQTAESVPAGLDRPVLEAAHALLDERCRRVLEDGSSFESLDPAERHKLRIQIKKLRYAAEFFGSLYPRRQLASYLAALKGLQDLLGAANDVEVARKLLTSLVKPARGKQRTRLSWAAGLVVGWHSHLSDDHEQRLLDAWQRFAGAPPFWASGEPVANEGAQPSAQEPNAAPQREAESAAGTYTGELVK